MTPHRAGGDGLLRRAADWIAPPHGTPIEMWRQRILAATLLGLAVFGLLTYFPSVWAAQRAGETAIVLLDTVAYLLLLTLLFGRRLPYAWRAGATVALPAVLGTFFLWGFGSAAAGFAWVMAFPIMAAVLLGLRRGVQALACLALILVGIGALIPLDAVPWSDTQLPGMPAQLVMWVVNGTSVMLLAGITTLSIGVLFDGLAREADARLVAEAEMERLASAVDQSDGLVVLFDADGQPRYVNRAARALLGDDPRACVADAWTAAIAGRAWSGSTECTGVDGAPLALSGTVSPVRDARGAITHVLATLRDVRRERALELRLQQGQKLEAIGTLAGGIAHDFNNLLQPIVLNTESAQHALPGDHAAQPMLADVRQSADRARALVRRILTFTRAMEHERRAIDLAALVRETERLLRSMLPAEVIIDCDARVRASVVAEPGELQQVLLNLATNAAHAMPGGGRLTIAVDRVAADGRQEFQHVFAPGAPLVRLTIADTGVGMDAATLARAFDPFFTTKGPGRGSGLGLAMAHGTITTLGGVILPESEPGRGTTMRIWLPLAEAGAAAAEAPAPVAAPARASRIFLVDDEPAVRRATERLLGRLGWTVEVFDDPLVVAARFREARDLPDCLLTDLSMPGMTGLQLAAVARAADADLPIVLMTGYLEHPAEAEQDPRVQVMVKPFGADELQRALDAARRG